MFDNMSDSQYDWLKSITWICAMLIMVTVLLRGCVIPDRTAEKIEEVQKTLDWQYAPYATVLQNYSLQHPDQAPIMSAMDGCTREDLKSHLSPAHPRIDSKEAATSFRACMLSQVTNDMRSEKPDDQKQGALLASITTPLANAIAAARR